MKNLLFILIISLFSIPITFGQSEKTFVKSFTADSKTVLVDMEGEVKVSEWDEKFIRVTTTVEVLNFNEEILKRLVTVGRYAIVTETIDGAMKITMPKLSTKVTIRGNALEEVLSYQIFVPKGTTVEVVHPDSGGNVN